MSELRDMMRAQQDGMAARFGAAPAAEAASIARTAGRRRAVRVAAVAGVGVVIAGAVGGGVWALQNNGDDLAPVAPSDTASPSASPSPTVSPTTSASPTASPTPTVSPSPDTSETGSAWAPDFPMPDGATSGDTVATFEASDAWAMQPILSPDGKHVVAGRLGMDGLLFLVGSIDGSPLKPLAKPHWLEQVPAWSPDSARVAYITTTSSGPALATVKSDGTGLRVVSSIPDLSDRASGIALSISWSADGSTIAVSQGNIAGELSESAIMLIPVAGGNATTIEGAAGAAYAPSGSTLVYYGLSSAGKPQLMSRVGNGAAKAIEPISGPSWGQWIPGVKWASDGSRVAYRSNWTGAGAGEWRSVTAAGGDDVKMTNRIGGASAAWAPDSRHFAAANSRNGLIYVSALDGSVGDGLGVDGYDVSWADSRTVVTSKEGLVSAWNIETGTEAWGDSSHATTSSTYVVAPDRTGILTLVDLFEGTGSVSVHR